MSDINSGISRILGVSERNTDNFTFCHIKNRGFHINSSKDRWSSKKKQKNGREKSVTPGHSQNRSLSVPLWRIGTRDRRVFCLLKLWKPTASRNTNKKNPTHTVLHNTSLQTWRLPIVSRKEEKEKETENRKSTAKESRNESVKNGNEKLNIRLLLVPR